MHGGRVEARSAGVGQGSEFIVSLPGSLMRDTRKGLEERSSDSITAASLRVLIADDNQDGAEALGLLMEIYGHEVHLAHSGAEALEVASQFRPDVGILDIGMPDLDGYEVAKRIRHEAWGTPITLIALTGWGQDNDKRLAHAAGFDHHVTKPASPEHLCALFGVRINHQHDAAKV